MGIVYRAHDLHLERDVALKVLAPRKPLSGESEMRFRREALALSRLNHPNIAAVYDFDVQDDIRFLVMEWIAGTTLSAKLRFGPLPEREIIDYGDQIASALGYAHGEGVIHRDLKPGNLRIASDGRIKILDFGLAKLRPTSDTAVTETLPNANTVAGTLPYIAPEVLNGYPASAASDVYSVAAVLYEMATARRAFPQDDAATLTVAIVSTDPLPPRRTNAAISEELEHVILRGLAKNPEHRYATASELRADLRRITSGLPLILPRRRTIPRYVQWIAVAAVVALLIAAPSLVGRRETPRSPIMTPIVTWPSTERGAQISPDKQWVAFLSDQGGTNAVWLQRVKGGEPRLLVSREGLSDARWSPDGESIGILSSDADGVTLQMMAAFGGRATTTLKLPGELSNATFMRWYGNNIYLDLPRDGVWRVDTTSGSAKRVFDAGTREEFDIHPDEQRLAYSMKSRDQQTIWIGNIDGGRADRLTNGSHNDAGPRFGGRDFLYFTSDRSSQIDVWRRRLDDRTDEQITFSRAVEYVQDVSDDLTMLTFLEEQDNANLWMLDPSTGRNRQLTAESVRDDWPAVAHNGRVAVQRQKPVVYAPERHLRGAIHVAQSAGAPWTRIADGGSPSLSPDGRFLAYALPRPGHVAELRVRDLVTNAEQSIAAAFRIPKYYPWPRDFDRSTLAWSDDGSAVFVAENSVGEDEIRAADVVFYKAPKTTYIREVYADANRIAFVTESKEAATLHVLDRSTLQTRQMRSIPRDGWKNTIYVRGALRNGAWVVLQTTLNADYTERAVVFEIDDNGSVREAGRIDRCFAGTAELDPARDLIYLTALDEQSVHNIYSLSLRDGATRQVTTNSVPGVSFAGFQIADNGDVLYVAQKHSEDVWLIDFQPGKETTP